MIQIKRHLDGLCGFCAYEDFGEWRDAGHGWSPQEALADFLAEGETKYPDRDHFSVPDISIIREHDPSLIGYSCRGKKETLWIGAGHGFTPKEALEEWLSGERKYPDTDTFETGIKESDLGKQVAEESLDAFYGQQYETVKFEEPWQLKVLKVQIQLAAMEAENTNRLMQGNSQAYGEEAFLKLLEKL